MLLRILLFPFSLLYGLVTFVRNKLYDWKFLSSVSYKDICVISIGNITVGGTGKTPHVEYLIRLLSPEYQIAVLSRGYKRKTNGFLLVETSSTVDEVGDEPYQMKQKFPTIVMAVNVDRIKGIRKIQEIYPDIQVILLDDAFQYRKIKPTLSILLADYNRPLYRDTMLPAGRLREYACSAKRADMMVITKSPINLSTEEQHDILRHDAKAFPHEPYFTTIAYGELCPVFPASQHLPIPHLKQYDVLLVAGIAYPKPLEQYLRSLANSVQTMIFPDHHAFSKKDIQHIFDQWENISSAYKLIITTEKDATRLQKMKAPIEMQQVSYYLPIEIGFLGAGESLFEQKIRSVISATLKH